MFQNALKHFDFIIKALTLPIGRAPVRQSRAARKPEWLIIPSRSSVEKSYGQGGRAFSLH
jgi:hypothetical protein